MFYLKCGLWKENDIYVQYKFVDIQYPPPALFNILLSCLFNILLSSSSISSPRPSSSSISSSHPLQNPFLIIFNSFPIPRPSISSISSSHTLQYPPLILFNILLSYTLQYPPLILINILLSPLQYPPILLFIILFSSSFIYLLIIYMKKKIVDFVCKFFLHPLSSMNTSLDTLFSFFLCTGCPKKHGNSVTNSISSLL